jgi:hypothetical protein
MFTMGGGADFYRFSAWDQLKSNDVRLVYAAC